MDLFILLFEFCSVKLIFLVLDSNFCNRCGPLDRVDKDGVRLYINTSQEAEEQEKKLRKYIIENLEGQFSVAAGGGYSDQMTVYYFMTALIWDIVLKVHYP